MGVERRGVLEVYSNSVVEAMHTDLGPSVKISSMEFGIKNLRLSAPEAVNEMTLTLWNKGSSDNDQDGIDDSALYVQTLDISGLDSSTSVKLANGDGVSAGAQRVYYSGLIGGTADQLDEHFIRSKEAGTIFVFQQRFLGRNPEISHYR